MVIEIQVAGPYFVGQDASQRQGVGWAGCLPRRSPLEGLEGLAGLVPPRQAFHHEFQLHHHVTEGMLRL